MPDRYYSIYGNAFVWDEEKNMINIRKHGVDFETAALVFNDDLRIEFPDTFHDGNEERYDTIGLVDKVLFVVYCDRMNLKTGGTDIRIISARPANRIEKAAYNNNIEGRI